MKKLLITGYTRSGTTLLANFLNAQEGILIYRDFLRTIFTASSQMGISSFLNPLSQTQRNILLSQLKAESWAIRSDMMSNIGKDFSNLKQLYDRALNVMQENKRYSVVGSKVTILGKRLTDIIRDTDVDIIYIYRDPRDILLSAKNRFANYDIVQSMLEFKADIESALEIKNKRLLVVKFEDLIIHPDKVIEQLSRFLGVAVKREVSLAKDREMDWTNNSSFHDIDQMFDKRACFRWMNDKNSSEVKYPEILMSDVIARLGYHLSGNKYSFLAKSLAYKDLSVRRLKNIGKSVIGKIAKRI